jgi:hypothetical protein
LGCFGGGGGGGGVGGGLCRWAEGWVKGITVGVGHQDLQHGRGDIEGGWEREEQVGGEGDSLITRRIMFWARDVRGGSGEREAFRTLLKYAAQNHPDEVIPNIHLIAEYGRWDDVFVLIGTPVQNAAIELIAKKLKDGDQLLAKWMPRTGGKTAPHKKLISNLVRTKMEMSPKEFRKMLVENTKVIETAMCSKDYSTVNYSHVPSLAMSRYSKAFMKNDEEKFTEYRGLLLNNQVKINTGAIYPYDVIKGLLFGEEDIANAQWVSLPNFMEGNQERVLPVCDVSGSMSTPVSTNLSAMDICVSLGLYISERNEGPFKDAFVTFSSTPELQYLKGNLKERIFQLASSNWGMSTNIEATFNLILNKAVEGSVPQEEMPTCILIMSDMEFDSAIDNQSAISMIARKYEDAGYELPKIVFWNLCARSSNFPVQTRDENTALISGFSPSILKSVLSGKEMTPITIMLDTVNSDRYQAIQ